MAGRPGRSGRRRQDHSSPLVDLDLVFADDRLIDRINAYVPTPGSYIVADAATVSSRRAAN